MNDRVSSIRIFGDAEVAAYKDSDFRGEARRFGRDVNDLRRAGFNDRISSFRVAEREGRGFPRGEGRGRGELTWGRPEVPRAGACFYENPNFEGRYFCAGVGEAREMVPPGMNDRVSSIRIFGDAEVAAYRDGDFRGDARMFGRDVNDLRGAGFNDRISSFRIAERRRY